MNYFQRLALRARRQPESRPADVLDDPFETVAPWPLEQGAENPIRGEWRGVAPCSEPEQGEIGLRDTDAPEADQQAPSHRPVPHTPESRWNGVTIPRAEGEAERSWTQAAPLPDTPYAAPVDACIPVAPMRSRKTDEPLPDQRQALAQADAFMRSLGTLSRSWTDGQLFPLAAPLLEQEHLLPGGLNGRPAPEPGRGLAELLPPVPPVPDAPPAAAGRHGTPATDQGRGGESGSLHPAAPAPGMPPQRTPETVVIVRQPEHRDDGGRLGLGAPRFGLGQL